MIGIIGAMDSEINELKANLSDVKCESISGIDFYTGMINGKNVVLAKSGIGKVYAAICCECMILKFKPDEIIHIGIAGALDDCLGLKDVAIASSVVQYDIDQTAFGEKLGFIQGIDKINIPCSKRIVSSIEMCAKKLNVNYKVGVIATGDKFIADALDKKMIVDNFNAIAAEMEGASTGQVCFVNGVDFCVVRAMSDDADENVGDTYMNTKQKASDISTRIILEYLN